jgi:hypothetical protein
MDTIADMVKELPPELQEEVRQFVQSLLKKRRRRPRGTPSFSWAGALKDMRGQYTSVQLQHQIAESRAEDK